MMKKFVDFDWLMDLYGDDWPEEVQNYKIPLADIRRNIVNAPYVTLREDETTDLRFWIVLEIGKRLDVLSVIKNLGILAFRNVLTAAEKL